MPKLSKNVIEQLLLTIKDENKNVADYLKNNKDTTILDYVNNIERNLDSFLKTKNNKNNKNDSEYYINKIGQNNNYDKDSNAIIQLKSVIANYVYLKNNFDEYINDNVAFYKNRLIHKKEQNIDEKVAEFIEKEKTSIAYKEAQEALNNIGKQIISEIGLTESQLEKLGNYYTNKTKRLKDDFIELDENGNEVFKEKIVEKSRKVPVKKEVEDDIIEELEKEINKDIVEEPKEEKTNTVIETKEVKKPEVKKKTIVSNIEPKIIEEKIKFGVRSNSSLDGEFTKNYGFIHPNKNTSWGNYNTDKNTIENKFNDVFDYAKKLENNEFMTEFNLNIGKNGEQPTTQEKEAYEKLKDVKFGDEISKSDIKLNNDYLRKTNGKLRTVESLTNALAIYKAQYDKHYSKPLWNRIFMYFGKENRKERENLGKMVDYFKSIGLTKDNVNEMAKKGSEFVADKLNLVSRQGALPTDEQLKKENIYSEYPEYDYIEKKHSKLFGNKNQQATIDEIEQIDLTNNFEEIDLEKGYTYGNLEGDVFKKNEHQQEMYDSETMHKVKAGTDTWGGLNEGTFEKNEHQQEMYDSETMHKVKAGTDTWGGLEKGVFEKH